MGAAQKGRMAAGAAALCTEGGSACTAQLSSLMYTATASSARGICTAENCMQSSVDMQDEACQQMAVAKDRGEGQAAPLTMTDAWPSRKLPISNMRMASMGMRGQSCVLAADRWNTGLFTIMALAMHTC